MGMVVNQRGVRGTRAHPVTYAGKPRWSSTREPEGVFYDAFVASPIGIALENLEGRPPLRVSLRAQGWDSVKRTYVGNIASSFPRGAETDWALFTQLQAGLLNHSRLSD